MSGSEEDDERRERRRETRRKWEAANPDRVLAHRARYREKNRERINALERESARKRRERARDAREAAARAEDRRAKDRERIRNYKAANRERLAEQDYIRKRRWIAKQRETDLVAYRAKVSEYAKGYQARHRDEVAHKAKDRRLSNPYARLEYQAAYRAAHADELARKRREDYAKDPEKYLARNREWKRRERRRVKAGLPPRRVHHTTLPEMRRHDAEADAFFSRGRSVEEMDSIRVERMTDSEVKAYLEREFARARAEAGFDTQAAQLVDRRSIEGARRLARSVQEFESQRAAEAEDARLDAIARVINDRLRGARSEHARNESAPYQGPGTLSTGGSGLSR
jgi:hypothetical protein